MAVRNDETIPDDAVLYRVLKNDPLWTKQETDRYRPSSLAFKDGNRETSLFLDAPGILDELKRMFPGCEIASVRAATIRVGPRVWAIERRPDEVPEDFALDRNLHVIIGPPAECGPKPYEKKASAIAVDATTEIAVRREDNPPPPYNNP